MSLMLLFSLSGQLAPSVQVLAEVQKTEVSSSSEVVEEVETKEVTKKTTDTKESTKTSETEEVQTEKPEIGKSQNSNDSPKVTVDDHQVPTNQLADILDQYGYYMTEDGKFLSRTNETIRDNWNEFLEKVQEVQGNSQVGRSLSPLTRAGVTIYVDQNYSIPTASWDYSSGIHDSGFYAKRDANGGMLWCVAPGNPLNFGANGGFTPEERDQLNLVIASLIAYWGYETQPSVANAFYTERHIQRMASAVSTSNIQDPSGTVSQAGYEAWVKETDRKINSFLTKPSFDTKSFTMKKGDTLRIDDVNSSLWAYKVATNDTNMNVSIDGNTLVIKATGDVKDGTIQLKYNIPTSYQGATLVYRHPYSQELLQAAIKDPNITKVNIKVLKNGNAKIKKVDADTGKAISGAKFKLSYDGKQVEVVTNATGEAELKDITHGTKVTIQEIQAANGYVINQTPQTVTIEADQTVTAIFKNKKQVGRLDLIKEDKETGNQPQGSAKLDGAVYGLFETNGQKVKEVTLKQTGDKVTGSFENIQIMHDYYVQEIKAPEGYNVDGTKYPVNIAYAGQDQTVAVQSMSLKDQVIKGGVEIVKIGNKPLVNQVLDKLTGKSDNVKPKLEGAEFTITSKTTGKPVKVIITDKDGKASTGKTLPYDSYIMTETKTPEGYLTIEPIEFTVSEEDQTFFWVLEDKIIESQLQLIKVDAETGKNIPLRDTTFKIWDRLANDGEGGYVSMRVPNSLEVSDEFKTNEKGELVTNDSLPFGKDRYEIRELRAPEGYLLATEPVVFSVTEADAGGVITIKFKNMPQKGQVKIHKTGEKGISAVEKESEYGKYAEIQYDQVDLANVKFKIRAAEDITTPDGTVRLAKGDYIQKDGKDLELVTDDSGMTSSDPNLYLGKYEAIEIEAPNGFVMLEEPIPFEINYEGQLVELASTDVKVENTLQKIDVYGYKKQEVVTGWEDGKPTIELEDAKNDQVFGLYVGEEGIQIGFTILPHDTALAFVKVKDGKLAFEGLTLPNVESNFYIKEIDAGNDHVLDETHYGFQYVPSTNQKEHTIHVFADGYAENKEILTKMARKEIENKLAYTDVELVKTDNLGNKPLEGVEFQLIREDDKKETVVDTYKTDKDGKIIVEKLPTGNYRFKETKPLSWYYPNEDDLSFEVTPETNGQVISLKAVNKRKPMEITTFLATVDGNKEADPTVDNILRDEVEIKGAEVGHTYSIVTPYVDPETKKVITTVESTYTAEAENETIQVDIPIEKNTMKDGQKGVATHYIYYDKEKTKEIGKEDNLENTDQMVTFKERKVFPKTTTVSKTKTLPKTNDSQNIFMSVIGLILLVGVSVVVFVRRKTCK
ncbi:LPXTG-domain-containing protein cell wall anchor domain [Enterococcus pallens]|nr:LPXTG-domain-containing protein cell wall anchor domain [Enterococcus pallens]